MFAASIASQIYVGTSSCWHTVDCRCECLRLERYTNTNVVGGRHLYGCSFEVRALRCEQLGKDGGWSTQFTAPCSSAFFKRYELFVFLLPLFVALITDLQTSSV